MDDKIHAEEQFAHDDTNVVRPMSSDGQRPLIRVLLFAWIVAAFLAYMWQFRDMLGAALRIFSRG